MVGKHREGLVRLQQLLLLRFGKAKLQNLLLKSRHFGEL